MRIERQDPTREALLAARAFFGMFCGCFARCPYHCAPGKSPEWCALYNQDLIPEIPADGFAFLRGRKCLDE